MLVQRFSSSGLGGQTVNICEMCKAFREDKPIVDLNGEKFQFLAWNWHEGVCQIHDREWSHDAAFSMLSRFCPERMGELWETDFGTVNTPWALFYQYQMDEMDLARLACQQLAEGKIPDGWEPHKIQTNEVQS
jgi:hypothetical protein